MSLSDTPGAFVPYVSPTLEQQIRDQIEQEVWASMDRRIQTGEPTTTITRSLLTGLVAQTNGRVTMDWPDDAVAPTFYDKTGINLTPDDAMYAVGRIAKTVMVRGAEKAEAEARAKLKAKGATDADLDAAARLMRAMPEGGPLADMDERIGPALMDWWRMGRESPTKRS